MIKYSDKTYSVHIGANMNTTIPRHLLQEGQTPWMKNAVPKNGMLKKRFGWGVIHDFGYECLGFTRPNDSLALIAVSGGDSGPATIYNWDLAVDDTATFTTVITGFNSKQKVNFCFHYDNHVGRAIIFCNGEDGLFYYPYTDASPAAVQIISNGDPTFQPEFCASYYNQLFVAKTNYLTTARAYGPFEVAWSAADNATDFTANIGVNYMYRTEDDAEITGLYQFQDTLLLGKEHQLWQIQPSGGGAKRINSVHGFHAPQGIVSGNALYFVEDGKVWMTSVNDASGLAWLSYPVHNNFAASDAGSWENITGAYDEYFNQVVFSTGNFIWGYDEIQQTWFCYDFEMPVKVLGTIPPQQKLLYLDNDLLVDHVLILAEEALTSDIIYFVNNQFLAKQYTRYFDGISYDEGYPITMQYDTPWLNMGSFEKKRLRRINVYGTKGRTVNLYYDYDNSPREVNFTLDKMKIGVIDDQGVLKIDMDLDYKWYTFRFEESSKDNMVIYQIDLEYQAKSER